MSLRPRHNYRPTWDQLTHTQVVALCEFHFAIPIHWTYATKILRLRGNTLSSLISRNLLRREYYSRREYLTISEIPLLTLTQEGLRIKRDWESWNLRVHSSVSQIFTLTKANLGPNRTK